MYSKKWYCSNDRPAFAWQTVNLRKSLITADQAVEAVRDVANKMHPSLKELGKEGGLAGTREGEILALQMQNGCLKCTICNKES